MNENIKTEVRANPKNYKIGWKGWLLIWGLGLAGQLCWCVENNWFANYLGREFGYNPGIVTAMTICSALATTFATFLFGTWSDRKGTRKPFVAFGYIAWGVFTIVYGLTHLYSQSIYGNVVAIGIVIVLTDTVMSFFGSAGNDSGFNAWCSDMLSDGNRGQIGATLAVQPVLGTLVGTVAGGAIIEAFSKKDPLTGEAIGATGYMEFFIIMGIFVMLFGILALFTMKNAPKLKPYKNGSFWHQFASVFNFKKFFKMKELVWINVAVTVYFVGFNCFFLHVMGWLNFSLQFGEGNAGMLLGIPLIIATLISIPAIFLINKNRSPIVAFFSIAVTIIGALYIFFVVGDGSGLDPNRVVAGYSDVFNIKNLPILIGITLLGIGYVCSIQTYMVWQKKLYPDEQRGQFEGIRILFFVLFPMVLGSLIAQPIIEATGASRDIIGINGMVYTESLPTHYLFIGSAVLALLSIIPLIFATRLHNERVKLEKTAEVIVAPID